jgi:hypothetical protein
MTVDEKEILEYLRSWPYTFISGREIARKVGGKARYAENRSWPLPILIEMTNKGWVETDCMGYFRIVSDERKPKRSKVKRYVSPQILRILKVSGREFEGVDIDIDLDVPGPIPIYREPGSFENESGTLDTRDKKSGK